MGIWIRGSSAGRGAAGTAGRGASAIATRTRTKTIPYDTKASAAGLSGCACAVRVKQVRGWVVQEVSEAVNGRLGVVSFLFGGALPAGAYTRLRWS